MPNEIKGAVEMILAVLLGIVAAKVLLAIRWKQWRYSIRGLLFATTLIAIALAMLVANVRE